MVSLAKKFNDDSYEELKPNFQRKKKAVDRRKQRQEKTKRKYVDE
jgi:hypothetical protein